MLHLFLANLVVARLAGLLGQVTGVRFWLLHAGLIGLATLLLACAAVLFRRLLGVPASGPGADVESGRAATA